jgi:hypothetical protein
MNTLLRIVMAIVTTCMVVAAANYYLGFGWFGAHARLVFSISMLLTVVCLIVVIQLWSDHESKRSL